MSKNNLFKLLFVTLFAFAATAFTGCSDDNDELTSAPVLVATPTSLSFGEEGGTRQIAIEANCAWTVNASTLEGWADVTPLSGEGSGTLTVTTYESTAAHQGVITFSLIHEYYGKWGKAETSIAVKQTVGNIPDPVGDALYEENCGTSVSKVDDRWPYVTAYEGWQRGGTLDQSGVTYGGTSSSVRNSGADYDDNTVSGAPYISVKTLEISKVNIASNTNFTFQFAAQNTVSTLSESPFTPSFGDITASSFKFEVGVNGTWYPVEFSVMALNGSAAWHQCTAMFKLPASVQTGELAFRWSGFTGGSNLRVDDLKLFEGGEGAVLGGGETPGPGDGYTFTKVSTVTSGKQYLFVADGKKAKYISTNYGYLQVDAVSDVNGKITVNSLEDAFTLTAADGGYTIMQSDNRYLIQTGNFDSFNVDAAPAEGQIFSIEPQTDGSFKILNTNVNKYMQFDAQYSSFGSYSDARGTMPFLYELGEGGGENPGPGTDPTDGTTIDFSAMGYANQDELPATIEKDGYTLTFDKGGNSNGPKWYDSGSAVRFYANNTLTVTGGTLKSIELVFGSVEYDYNKITTNVPTYAEPKWTGEAASVTFTVDGVRGEQSSEAGKQGGNRRIVKVIINGGGSGEEPGPGPEPGDATPIADILKLGQDATIENAKIVGTVISNAELNNLTSKKGLYVQDATAGLQFYCAANHEFKFGDKVQIDLSGLKVGNYNGAVQISGLALANVTKLSEGNAVEAKTVSVDDFLANKYEGQYVAIEDVQVSDLDLDKTWVSGGNHTSIQMVSKSGRNFYVFSSKYATYKDETVAQGSGTIKGIASINKGVMQIIFAQASDFAGLTGARFDAGEQPAEPKVTTAAYKDLTAESVTLGGSFEGFTAAPAEAGVEYLLFSTGTVADLNWATATKVKAASVASPFTVAVTGLIAETQYAYRAYAGDVYGEPMTFVTPAAGSSETWETVAEALAAGNHSVKATVVGINNVSVMLADNTGKILVYLGKTPSVAVGDVVTAVGEVESRFGLYQFKSTTVLTKVESGAYTQPAPVEYDGAKLDAFYNAPAYDYVTFKGTLACEPNGKFTNYYVTVAGTSTVAAAQIYRPLAAMETDLKAMDGKTVTVTGYMCGTTLVSATQTKYSNVMALSVVADGEQGGGDEPDPTGKSVALTAADIAKIGGSYADFSLTAADGSAWSGFGMLNAGYLQLGWNQNTTKDASKCYVLTPEVSGAISTITITPDSANKTYSDRVFAALPVDFVYTGQSVDEVKAAAYAYSANTVQGSTDPLTIDLKGKNLKQVVIRAVGGACYVADIKVEFE